MLVRHRMQTLQIVHELMGRDLICEIICATPVNGGRFQKSVAFMAHEKVRPAREVDCVHDQDHVVWTFDLQLVL